MNVYEVPVPRGPRPEGHAKSSEMTETRRLGSEQSDLSTLEKCSRI